MIYAYSGSMKLALPINGDRISPVLDVARRFVLVDVRGQRDANTQELDIESTDLPTKVKRIAAFGTNVLICGAISRPLESMFISAGVRVIPNTCGTIEEVIAAFIGGRLTEKAFLMPGCQGHRRRRRQGQRWGRKR